MGELRGAPVAAAILEGLAPDIARLNARGITPCLGVVRVGSREEDLSYERGLRKRFEAAGAALHPVVLPGDCTQAELEGAIRSLNADAGVHGILLFRPLPTGLDSSLAEELVSPAKDVDGMSPHNGGRLLFGWKNAFAPCTAEAVMELLSHYKIPLAGKRAVIVGRSAVVGKPLALLLLAQNATPTLCHTKTADLAAECRRADILVACAGKAGLVTADMVNENTVVIDVGMSMANGRLMGDVSPEAAQKAAAFTPVPGGVGAVTNTVLLSHTAKSAQRS